MGKLIDELTKELSEEMELRSEVKQVLAMAEVAKEQKGALTPDLIFKAMVQAIFGKMNWS